MTIKYLLLDYYASYEPYLVHRHRDGHRIRPSRKHLFTLGTEGLAVLIVKNAEYQDGGLYSCTAANEMGRVESFCRVSVQTTDYSLTRKKQPSRYALIVIIEVIAFLKVSTKQFQAH